MSVLDRLLVDSDRALPDGRQPSAVMADIKRSVQRDLVNLLNTRWRFTTWPPNLKEIEQSLVNYGIPDITAMEFGTHAKRQEFRSILERCIKRFEPRFKSVRVEIVDHNERLDRTLHFRINAEIYAQPEPEPVVFDTSLEPATAEFQVKRAER